MTNDQLFINAIKDVDPFAHQPWVDEKGWIVHGTGNYSLQIWLRDGYASVSPHGYGGVQSLIAKTPEELKQCCEMWWRNRHIE